MYLNRHEIILASGSPRRRESLQKLGLRFSVVVADIDEQVRPGEKPDDYVVRMAKEKAAAVGLIHPLPWIVAGDTIVCLGDRIFGKPASKAEAIQMLEQLSGRWHQVKTAVCVRKIDSNIEEVQVVTSKVLFKQFGKELARAYVESGESMDKAGGYAIQGLGTALITEVEGSYSNIVGLPLSEVIDLLVSFKVVEVSGI